MEVHHIVPQSEGGQDTIENAIALCFDCHAEVGSYNPKHPKGRKFSPRELMKHKEQWLKQCSSRSTSREMEKVPKDTLSEKDLRNFEAIFEKIRLDDLRITQYIVRRLFLMSRDLSDRFFVLCFKS
jgi:cytochrome c553